MGRSLKYGTGGGTFYGALNVPPSATFEEIRKQYYAAALQLHPDKQNNYTGMLSVAGDLFSREGDCDGIGLGNSGSANAEEEDSIERVHRVTRARLRTIDAVSGEVLAAEMTKQRYLRVVEAWDVLKDEVSRAEYDKRIQEDLKRAKEQVAQLTISDEIDLEEMEHHCVSDGEGCHYTYPCRCGDVFLVSKDDLRIGGIEGQELMGGSYSFRGVNFAESKVNIVVPCNSCSLNVLVSARMQSLHNPL